MLKETNMKNDLIELVEYMEKEKKRIEDYSKEEIFIMGQKVVINKLYRQDYRKNWYTKNKKRLHEKYLQNYAQNKKEMKAKSREYYYAHAEERKAYHNEYMKRRAMTDEEIINEVSMRGVKKE